ncbi:MAG: phytoene desaturase family protein [Cellvibrionaceae bacterium]
MTSATSEFAQQQSQDKPSEPPKAAKKGKKVSVRTGKRYRPGRADDRYDVVIVGSGIGGLANAAFLSLLGQKVCVLEQHYTAGGFTHAYEREGYEWDVGVHYIGDVHKRNSTMRRVFDVISEGRLKWAAMERVYDRIIIDGEKFDFVAGPENFIRELSKHFPTEESAIRSYVDLIRDVSSKTPKFFAAQAMPPWMAKVYNWLRPHLVRKEYFQTTREVLEGLTDNQKLISVLTGQWGDYGQVPRDAAFIMHALIAKHYLAGGAYPVGGASSMAREIIPTIQRSGGEVFTYAEVEQVLVKNNSAYGVKMADGSEILADKVVSNAGFMNTVTRLLPEASRQQHRTPDWQQKVEYSSASLCLYAGFKGDTKALDLDTTNLWIYPNGDHESNMDQFQKDQDAEFPLVYVSFPSTKDPEWAQRYPNKSTVEVVTMTNMDWFERWNGTTWQQRGDDYESYKNALAKRLLDKLFEHKPQLREALDYYELSSPLSTQFYQLNARGEIYGLNHFVDRFKQPFLHTQTPIKNLYMTGADMMTAGVGGALMAGMMTSMRMLGITKMGQIKTLLMNYKAPVDS